MTISRVVAGYGYFPNYDTETSLKINGLMLAHAQHFEKNDFKLVKIATIQNPDAFAYASERIKADLDMIQDLLKTCDASFIRHAKPMFLHDDGIILRLLKDHIEVFPYICSALSKNQSFLKEAFYTNNRVFYLFPIELQTDSYFLTSLCSKDEQYQPEVIEFLLEKMDATIKKRLVANPLVFASLSKEQKNFPPLAKLAIELNQTNIQHLASELALDTEFFKYLVFSIDPNIYQHAPLNLKLHEECAFLAISRDPSLLEYAPLSIKDQKRIGLTAVSINASAYQFLSARLKKDVEIVAHAFLADPSLYDTFPVEARTHYEFWAIVLHASHSFLDLIPEECLYNATFWEQLLKKDEDLAILSPASMYC